MSSLLLVALIAPPELAPPPRAIDSDASEKRSLRWVLRFKITNGKDYLDQLKALDAIVVIPVPPDGKGALLIRDLSDPSKQRKATDDDVKELAERIKFSDSRKEAVEGLAGALGLDLKPDKFWAFFPRSVEDELARKELAYRNKKHDEIEQTVFRITIRGGKAEILVDEQILKKP